MPLRSFTPSEIAAMMAPTEVQKDTLYPCFDAASTRHAWVMFTYSLRHGAGERDPDGAKRIEAHIRDAAQRFGVELEDANAR